MFPQQILSVKQIRVFLPKNYKKNRVETMKEKNTIVQFNCLFEWSFTKKIINWIDLKRKIPWFLHLIFDKNETIWRLGRHD